MKAPKTKTTSSNLQTQNQQETQPFFKKDVEATFFSEASSDLQTKPFFSPENHRIPDYHSDNTPFFNPATIQPKPASPAGRLTIGQPNDKYEQEADAKADEVVQKLEQPNSTQPDLQTKCTDCEQEEELQKKEAIEESDKAIQEKPIFESEAEPDIQTKVEHSLLTPEPVMAPSLTITNINPVESPIQKEELEQDAATLDSEIDLQRKPIFESEAEPDIQTKAKDTPITPEPVVAPALTISNINPTETPIQKEEIEQEESTSDTEVALQSEPVLESNAEPEFQTKAEDSSTTPEQVVTPPLTITNTSSIDTPIQKEEIEQEEETEQESELQRQSIFDAGDPPPDENPVMAKSEAGQTNASSNLEQKLNSSKGSGNPLPKSTADSMGSAMGADFSGVNIHTGTDAVEMNQGLGAQAFTHGSDIYFNKGKYDTESSGGKHLLAHELTHVVQQGGGGNNLIFENPNPVIQRTCPPDCAQELTEELSFEVRFRETYLTYTIRTSLSGLELFYENQSSIAILQEYLESIFTPESGPIHETPEYLTSGRITRLIERDVNNSIENGGGLFLTTTEEFISNRIHLIQENELLYRFEQYLEANTDIDPSEITWNSVIPRLLERLSSREPQNIIEASDFDLYDLVLRILLADSIEQGNPGGNVEPNIPILEEILFQDFVLNTLTLQDFSSDTENIFGERFLREWLSELEEIRYVPENFEIEDFQPIDSVEELEQHREDILYEFIEYDVPNLTLNFVLDEWASSGVSPEEWLANLELENYRESLLDHLVDNFMEMARDNDEFLRALRIASLEESRFRTIRGIHLLARVRETYNNNLRNRFENSLIEDLYEEELAIAQDPYRYTMIAYDIANATFSLLESIQPGQSISSELLEFTRVSLEALEIPESFASFTSLLQLFQYVREFQQQMDEQESRARETIREGIEVSFEDLAAVINNLAQIAEEFITNQWIPMLKEVAIEKLISNRDELQYIYDNWNVTNQEVVQRLSEGAEEYDLLAARLRDGSYATVEMNGSVVRARDAQKLQDAANFMRVEARIRRSAEGQEQKKEEILQAIELFNTVEQDIINDEYDPLDYSSAVYQEARSRLGISEFSRFTTTLQVLRGDVVAENNPFLARTIQAWHWRERSERAIEQLLVLGGMVVLSLAAMLVPGIGGVVLLALDIGLSIGMGVQGVANAQELLNMARLDTHQDIRGVSVARARRALMWAWIGLGVSIILEGGQLALISRIRVRGRGGVDLSPRTRAWEEGLNSSTRQMLNRNPALRRLWSEMNPAVRRLLTLCSSPCIPRNATPLQIQRIEGLTNRIPNMSAVTQRALKEFLYRRRRSLGSATNGLSTINTERQLNTFLNRYVASTARGGSAARIDGIWVFTRRGDGRVMREYSVASHGRQPGSNNFFQSHHGIQNAWAKNALRRLGYRENRAPALLLRDSHTSSPHRIITNRQNGRGRNYSSRTYEVERANTRADLRASGVPNSEINRYMRRADQYFGELYRTYRSRLQGRRNWTNTRINNELRRIFGNWRPR